MSGRRIRWGNAGRAAAIAAAVLAGLAVLPALLGEDEPPPLPADVGLSGVAPAAPAPVAPPPAAPVTTRPSRAMPVGGRVEKRRSKRGAGGRTAEEGGRGRTIRRARRPEGEPMSEPSEPAAPQVPAYLPTYEPAPAAPGRQEFRIEG